MMNYPEWLTKAIKALQKEGMEVNGRTLTWMAVELNCENPSQAAYFLYEEIHHIFRWQAQQEGGAQ